MTLQNTIYTRPLTKEAFEPFGDVIDTEGALGFPINNRKCTRYHDLARVEFTGTNARPIINIFRSEAFEFPFQLDGVERHPYGSQAFVPLSDNPFLVVVCPDEDGVPGTPEAFITQSRQGINFRSNVWHGTLSPLLEAADFLVVDREGEEKNLEEFLFQSPFHIRSNL